MTADAKPVFGDAQEAFRKAIAEGRLSEDHESCEYAGDFMYMGTHNGIDQFKNRNTREYLHD